MRAYSNAIVYLLYLLQNITNKQTEYKNTLLSAAAPMHSVTMVPIRPRMTLKINRKGENSSFRDYICIDSDRMYLLDSDKAKN